ncbi:MAG: tetratricopeptide repeat protein [Chloroflexota bacterium]|nr:tetratricopeptide repeat protein [Chloroflexota bacterium]
MLILPTSGNYLTSEIETVLYRAQLLLEEGQLEAALAILETARPSEERHQQERDYLLGWCYTQQQRWHEATHILLSLCKQENTSGSDTEIKQSGKHSRREQLARSFLRLGDAAVNLSRYSDASRHYLECLRHLQHLKMSSAALHYKAHYGQGVACLMLGLYEAAMHHYQEARALYTAHEDEEELAHIYYGLCYTYRYSKQLIDARIAGEKALEIYERKANHALAGRMRNLLGRISFLLGEFTEAADFYSQALSIALIEPNFNMIAANYIALADLHLAEGRVAEARDCCQRAIDEAVRITDEHIRGLTYFGVGKVLAAEARMPASACEMRSTLLERACTWFERAGRSLSQTQANADLAELYGRWADVLEDLGQAREAAHCWRQAYLAIANTRGAGWS